MRARAPDVRSLPVDRRRLAGASGRSSSSSVTAANGPAGRRYAVFCTRGLPLGIFFLTATRVFGPTKSRALFLVIKVYNTGVDKKKKNNKGTIIVFIILHVIVLTAVRYAAVADETKPVGLYQMVGDNNNRGGQLAQQLDTGNHLPRAPVVF